MTVAGCRNIKGGRCFAPGMEVRRVQIERDLTMNSCRWGGGKKERVKNDPEMIE